MTNIFLLCSAVLMILFGALSFNVSRSRMMLRDSKISPEKMKLVIRNQGNASEYIPLFIAVFLYFSLSSSNWFAGVVAISATVSRVFHAIGMHLIENVNQRHPLRFVGALGTYICIFLFGCILIARAL